MYICFLLIYPLVLSCLVKSTLSLILLPWEHHFNVFFSCICRHHHGPVSLLFQPGHPGSFKCSPLRLLIQSSFHWIYPLFWNYGAMFLSTVATLCHGWLITSWGLGLRKPVSWLKLCITFKKPSISLGLSFFSFKMKRQEDLGSLF